MQYNLLQLLLQTASVRKLILGGKVPTLHFVIRTPWGPVQAKGVADAGSAAFRVSGLELGGLFGSLLAGRISDYLIASKPKGGNVGKRVQARSGS